MAEWEELTERTLEDLERRWLAGGGEGRGREGRVGENNKMIFQFLINTIIIFQQ